jgi:hypothetical protein
MKLRSQCGRSQILFCTLAFGFLFELLKKNLLEARKLSPSPDCSGKPTVRKTMVVFKYKPQLRTRTCSGKREMSVDRKGNIRAPKQNNKIGNLVSDVSEGIDMIK